MRVLLLVLLVLPLVHAQGGPEVAVLVYHPYPDDADPLGFEFKGDRDAFVVRHGRFDLDRDGFDFPSFVADGQIFVEGLGDGAPVASTLQAYEDAVSLRLQQEPAATLQVATMLGEELRVRVWVEAPVVMDGLHLWVALVEDPVHYEPPPALSNGVFEHPFVVRHILPLGEVAVGSEASVHDLSFNATGENQHVVAWLEQDGSALGRFEAHEVVQAVIHKADRTTVTVQATKAVLVEAYSATWCAPCLYGDEAIDTLANNHGLTPGRGGSEPDGYFLAPPLWVLAPMVLALLFFAFLRLPEAR